MGIRTYCQNRSHKHIGVMSDSPTAITIKNAIKLQKILWLWCFKNTLSFLRHIYQGNTILKQINVLRNLTIIQDGNLIVKYLLKLLKFFYRGIDTFATRINTQLQIMFSGLVNLMLKQ